jgi:hypothetical protein
VQKSGEAAHHHYPKSKHDNLDNQIMRAFLKSIGARYKVANGEEALQMLRKSGQIRRDLNLLKPFCGIEGVQFSMSVTKWDSQIPQHPGMDVRGFVYGVSDLYFFTILVYFLESVAYYYVERDENMGESGYICTCMSAMYEREGEGGREERERERERERGMISSAHYCVYVVYTCMCACVCP